MKHSFWALLIGLVVISCSEKKERSLTFSNENIEILSAYIDKEKSSEGSTSFKMAEGTEWGPTWKYLEEDIDLTEVKSVDFNFDVLATNASDSLNFVFEIKDKKANKNVYEIYSFNDPGYVQGKWASKTVSFKLNGPYSKDSEVIFYFWNQKRKLFYVDNLKMKLK